jgi:hypothetical protein
MRIDHVIVREEFPCPGPRGSGHLSTRRDVADPGDDSMGRLFRIRDSEEHPGPPLIALPAHAVGLSACDDRQA